MRKSLKKTQRKVAVFDIDGTIFRSSLLIEITEALIQAGLFSSRIRSVYKNQHKRWLERSGSYEKYINAVVMAFEKEVKGIKRSDFSKVARQVVDRQHKRTYRYTRDLVLELKKKKYFIMAISSSPRDVVAPFCKKLGFSKVYARVYEVDKNNKFTGKTLYADLINDKAKILKRAVEKEGLTLKRSVGVGDTESDVAFLKMVAEPICFNPNKKLYTRAKRSGWKVVVERKDVIYLDR